MPISDGEWVSIRALVESLVGKKGEYLVTGEVIKRNTDDKTVFLAEFGDQPIPVVAFDYRVKYYDTDETGTVNVRNVIAEVQVPQIGDTVIVARELGVNRLPRCLGVLKGKNWIDLTEG